MTMLSMGPEHNAGNKGHKCKVLALFSSSG
jgi:hypothetical protein